MTEYIWNAGYATGYEPIDSQHKELFNAINKLMKFCAQGMVEEDLQNSMDFLSDYTIKHFFEEQRIQKRVGYPDYENHKKYHDGFKQVVRELSHQLIMNGPSESLVKDVELKCGDWLVSHIKVQDRKLVAFIREQEQKSNASGSAETN